MQIKFSLRFIFVIASLFALVLSFQVFITRIVIPDNVRTAKTLCNAIGAEYERTGKFPSASLLKWSDIRQDFGLAIQQAAKTGYTENRWGEEIRLIIAIINDPNGTQQLDLTVVARGPLGFGYASYGDSFDHVNGEIVISKANPDRTKR